MQKMEIFALPEDQSLNLQLDYDFEDIIAAPEDIFFPNHQAEVPLQAATPEVKRASSFEFRALSINEEDKKIFRSKSSRNVLNDRKGAHKKTKTTPQKNMRRTKSEDHTRADSAFSPNAPWRQKVAMESRISGEEKMSAEKNEQNNKQKNRNRQVKQFPEYNIDWDAMELKDEVKHVLRTQIPKQILEELLTQGENAFVKHAELVQRLTKEQQQAIRYIRKKTRAERKSRREKIRRIHVNNLLETLATTLELDNDNRDMASILSSAIEYVNRSKEELRVLRSLHSKTEIAHKISADQSEPMIISSEIF